MFSSWAVRSLKPEELCCRRCWWGIFAVSDSRRQSRAPRCKGVVNSPRKRIRGSDAVRTFGPRATCISFWRKVTLHSSRTRGRGNTTNRQSSDYLDRRAATRCSNASWCPRPDLNRNTRFRKPLLYPVELRGLGQVDTHTRVRRNMFGRYPQRQRPECNSPH